MLPKIFEAGVRSKNKIPQDWAQISCPSVEWCSRTPKITTFAKAKILHKPTFIGHKIKFLSRNTAVTVGHNLTNPTMGGIFTRYAHSDIKFPGYEDIRLDNEPHKDGPQAFYNQRFMYTSTIVASMAACVVIKETCDVFIQSLLPCERDLCEGAVEFDLNKLPYGHSLMTKWKKKALYVTHLTDEEIEHAKSIPLSILVDPETYEQRTPINPRYLVMIGVCTHLGCLPFMNKGDYGGYLCTCHGSHFDKIGRVRAGPAPKNLKIPEYRIDENSILYVD